MPSAEKKGYTQELPRTQKTFFNQVINNLVTVEKIKNESMSSKTMFWQKKKNSNSRSEIPIQVLKQRELYSLSSIVAGSGTVEDHTTALSRAKSEPYYVVVLVDTSIPLTYQRKRKQFVNKSQKTTDN